MESTAKGESWVEMLAYSGMKATFDKARVKRKMDIRPRHEAHMEHVARG